jgi:protein-disulfide isomerase
MRPLALVLLILTGCRPTDGGARSEPSSTATPAAATPPGAQATASDSARNDSLLQRADAGRIQGSPPAPVWLVEISDFQCPYCKQWHDSVYPALKREYIDKGIVRMAYVHLPLNIHPNAPAAAEASLCAGLQDRFWPVHDKLFATQARWATKPVPAATAYFDSLSVAAGVDASAFRDCVKSGLMRRIISGDGSRATAAGVRSTPVFFIGNESIPGLAPLEAYRQAIERARAAATSRPGR